MQPPRKTIDELLARYEFEPTVHDIYVEGPSDSHLVSYYVSRRIATRVEVYDIDGVDVPAALTSAIGSVDNARSRVIALARELEGQVSVNQVMCIVDADYDRLMCRIPSLELLAVTDYSCMEMYLADEVTIEKFLRLTAWLSDPPKTLLPILCNVVVELFLIRFALVELNFEMRFITFDRCCTLEDGTIRFDRVDFLRKLVHANCAHDRLALISQTTDELRPRLLRDPRQQMNGHDFLELLSWYLHRRNVPASKLPAGLRRTLMGCVSVDALDQEPLFALIRDRFA